MYQRKPILQDHKKQGKRLVPPILQLGNVEPVDWTEHILPELLWIALLYDMFGLKRSAEIIYNVSEICSSFIIDDKLHWLALCSTYSKINSKDTSDIVEQMKVVQIYDDLCAALKPLILFYPTFPMKQLFENIDELPNHIELLNNFKGVFTKYFNRWDVPATFIQAHAVYIAFTQDILKVRPHLTLASFPLIEYYPNTELSKRIASACRESVSMIYSAQKHDEHEWPDSFWNRGLELEPCRIPEFYYDK